MSLTRLLIANRGEIAIRIARAAAELGIATVSVYAEDDADSRHVLVTDDSCPLPGRGVAAYLDAGALVEAARETGCDAVHPGYGFLSESVDFARACREQGLTFVGPNDRALALFGDKARALERARALDIPVIPGTDDETSLAGAHEFLASEAGAHGIMVKALAGGGGRGMRAVHTEAELEAAFERCASEAASAFGDGRLYVEALIPRARHVEVQVVGDAAGHVNHLWERECTIQRRNQKLLEIAPSPSLSAELRRRICDAAVALARSAGYDGLGTFEFLVRADGGAPAFAFIEANPRLQVEHTVTEEVTDVDLVQTQLRIAGGAGLAELGLDRPEPPPPRGFAVQLRVNMEAVQPDGTAKPTGGVLRAFEPPTGPGLRVDTFGYSGYRTHPGFDSLLAKVIAHSRSGGYEAVLEKAYRALCEFRIEGVETNIGILQSLLRHPELVANRIHTRFLDEHAADLVDSAAYAHRPLYFSGDEGAAAPVTDQAATGQPPGTVAVAAPMQGRVLELSVAEGEAVRAGAQVALLDAMKMEHVVTAPVSGIVRQFGAAAEDNVFEGAPLLFLEEAEVGDSGSESTETIDLDAVRPDLAEVMERHAVGLDENRPEAVAKRHQRGQRMARENIDDLCDPGSFIEYGALALAAQRRRRELDELIRMSPADGLVGGMATINRGVFGDEAARCMVMSYDYTVFAGTQGAMNHKKTDRMLNLAEERRLPLVVFAEGGGGRPGDTDATVVAGLDVPTFRQYARLSGLVPRITVVSGRCFAGNAALAGCADIVVATENATLGMGGPAMIEGGGLGVYTPEQVGPMSMQAPNGVVDLVVADEAEAVAATRQLLGYFQGTVADWDCEDQRWLRRAIPENRLRAYDIRSLIEILADTGSVMELRREFAPGMITAFIRVEGRPLGLIANNPGHLGGAIDADGADKAARFMQLCDAFDIPILSLCDTPGIMVGPDAERTALVRHAGRMFIAGANVDVPLFTVVLRKGYGLGAQAMAGGTFEAPVFIVAWPTGEFGAMGLEGAVRLGYRKELAAIEDPEEREATFQRMVAESYEHGKAINMASHLEIDGVIDPMETRRWLVRGLESMPAPARREGKKRPLIDTW
ncbi:ATP-grasp domain-containing protein [Ectothiorhodospiraceae bacterium WFHF3C12]|nr:ATP-grasp domain-containing protein [Ectothiorhodospiraceae bacterium WFHF3C12]